MMSDTNIADAVLSGDIKIDNASEIFSKRLQANSVDIYMKPYVTDKYGKVKREAERGYVEVKSLEFVLATTQEYIRLSNKVSASVETRSSIGRQGIFTQNAGHIDAGFEGEITLELFNASDESVYIDTLLPVAQLVFSKLDTPAIRPYNGVYRGQKEVRPSKLIEVRD